MRNCRSLLKNWALKRAMNKSRFTDLLTQVLSLGLAAGCLILAGYKVISLRNMENPPADMGLNFPEPKRKVITDEPVLADPMPTNSTAPPETDAAPPRILQPYRAETPIQDYRLLTVIYGVAFVEVLTLKGREVVPVAVGSRLPGAGPVAHIEKRNGRWVLVAGEVTLRSKAQ